MYILLPRNCHSLLFYFSFQKHNSSVWESSENRSILSLEMIAILSCSSQITTSSILPSEIYKIVRQIYSLQMFSRIFEILQYQRLQYLVVVWCLATVKSTLPDVIVLFTTQLDKSLQLYYLLPSF